MSDLFSTIRFPGLYPVEQGQFTFSVGISPSIATVTATFVDEPLTIAFGDMELIYGSKKIVFLNCRLDTPDFASGPGGQAVTVRIADRRWKWEFGEITGSYDDKTSRELARLLLLAMGESGFDLLDLPEFQPPPVEWRAANPASELANLCEQGGCRVVLGLDNRVRLFRTGRGSKLPRGARETFGFGADLPSLGDSVKAYAQNTRWELLLELEAVGLETDYSIERMADLSYNPVQKAADAANEENAENCDDEDEDEENDCVFIVPTKDELDAGWDDQYPESLQALFSNEDERQVALKSLYRWYRVRRVAHFVDPDPLNTSFGNLPGFGKIDNLSQILPLLDTRNTRYFDRAAEETFPKPVEIEGVFYDTTNDPQTNINVAPKTKFRGAFTINAERGIVQFSDPVYKWATNPDPSGNHPIVRPADLFLRIAIEVRTLDEGAHHRAFYEVSTVVGEPQNTGPLIINDKEAREKWNLTYKDNLLNPTLYRLEDKQSSNNDIVQTDLEKTIARRLSELDIEESETATYTGLVKHTLDGAIPQISWSIGPSGASTTISRNIEHDLDAPTFLQKRREEKRRAIDNDNNP